MTPAIAVHDLRKAYGGRPAVDGISFAVEPGEVFALLGPNGAGKTTTVEILEGYRHADAGSVRVLGFDPATGGSAYRGRIGIVLQGSGVYPYMSPREVLRLFAGYYDAPRDVEEVLATVGLEDKAGALVRTLSGGQARRLDVALALVGNPQLIFLDEPTTGFDPGARRGAWEIVSALAAGGTTILLTTHYMDEAQSLADRVGVMRAGRLVAIGPPEALTAGADSTVEIRFDAPAGVGAAELARIAGGELVVGDGERVAIAVGDPTAALHDLTGWALARGCSLERLEVLRPSLEDVYLALTGGGDAEVVRS
jgi:ABC-2 type transport system ATP-binding protein